MDQLTKAEEAVMQVIWKIKKGFLSDILSAMPEPRPANSTVSTFLKILEKKGFVGHHTYGKIHEYFPLIAREAYAKKYVKGIMQKFFSNSYLKMMSALSKNEDLSISEIEEIIVLMKNQVEKRKAEDND